MEPQWVQHAIWWHVYPLGFVGADTTGTERGPAHRLSRLKKWLDHAVRLGASGLALGPIFTSSTHGYDTIDHRRIDPRLGDEQDFDDLVAAAHDRGLRVLLDGVFSHVGRDFPAFQRALRYGPDAPGADWFRFSWDAPEARYDTFEGHPNLVTLDHANPAVADYVTDVMGQWLARGVDGWRLDAAYAVPDRFWATVLPRVRRDYPDAYLVGEVIHGDYGAIVRETGLDSVTQYELWKAIWSSLNDRNLFELAWAFERHNTYLDVFTPQTFVGNHDVTRLASKLTDERHLAHALVVLLTTGGTPSIYYGDEYAFRGIKDERAGGDDAIRPAYPDDLSQLPEDGSATFRLHQELIGLRRRHPWLHRARTRVVDLANEHLVYESVDGERRLIVALNLSDSDLVHHSLDSATVIAGSRPAPNGNAIPANGWIIAEPGDLIGR
jgi:cyclomaltodextrinase